MEKISAQIGLILLAAGQSKRLGRPKQLLEFRGETLIDRSIKTALDSICRPIIVVVGANAENLRGEIGKFDVELIENPEWEKGMGTSVKIGVRTLLQNYPKASGAVLTVCDQPFVSSALINRLAEIFQTSDAPIIASSYENTLGVPALFGRDLFDELANLNADEGARKIIDGHREKVFKIPFGAGAIDVDTEQDYQNLIKSCNLSQNTSLRS